MAARWLARLAAHRAALLVLALGLAATLGADVTLTRLAAAKDQERFDNVVAQSSEQITGRLDTYRAVLRAGAGLFAARPEPVTQAEFRAFADRLDLPGVYPGIQGLGFSLRTPDRGGPATQRLLAQMGVPGLTLRTAAAPGEEVHAIVFLEPLDRRNQTALGFDMFADPVRRAAMAEARDTGRAVMSGKVRLVQEITGGAQAGFLLYQPVYRGGAVPPDVASRRERLQGFVYAPFRADDLLAGIFRGQPHPRLDFAIYDGPVTPENLLHRSFSGSEAELARRASHTTRRTLRLADRNWTLVFYARPDFELGSSRGLIWPFIVGGLVATLLVAAATARETRARRAAEQEVAARQALEDQRQLLIAELNHRVKNTLSAVQAIAAQTIGRDGDPRAARAAFEARLLALSHAHDLLTRERWQGAQLMELAALELAPYRRGRNVVIEGPATSLSPDQCVALAMALHELTTNAAKYGALSTAAGALSLTWTHQSAASGGTLELLWRERGGPPVAKPSRRGFGLRLIEQGVARQLRAEVEVLFQPEGLACRIVLPLAAVT
ncbi:CHASE domain-containing protein [Phenylobacterium soli]|uniref:CHASE domain-containing protein n=1 Tax=Phenylobacterium soli TaxID=2170551 RepID=UPI001403EB42|nr:CHASE domain-containing protein [Phenylobacterium soli]